MDKLKVLIEKRNTVLENMEKILSKVQEETRAMDENEVKTFNQYKEEIGSLDTTIEAQKYAEELARKQNEANFKTNPNMHQNPASEEQRMLDEKNFIDFVNGESRALDVAGNGAIIPQVISDRIIEKVRDLSPIYQMATVFQVSGDLIFPKFDYTTINVAFVNDMQQLTAQNGNFTTVKLQNFIAGSLVLVSRSLQNRTDFDLVSYIVNQMAMAIADFLEKQMLIGVGTTAPLGIFTDPAVPEVTAASGTALTVEDLIKTQMTVPSAYQNGAAWVMGKNTFQALRVLKDTTGQFLLNPDVREGFGFTLLGKPVYISENAPNTIGAGLDVLVYGDFSGLYIKLAQQVEIQVLNELYSTQHATGIVGYVELDSRVVETQKLVRLAMA